MRRQVGIKEVAIEAGVSITTVSHALNGKGRLSDETRLRVQEAAARLGYRPNLVARNLAGKRTGLIGLSVSQTPGGQFTIADFAYYSQLMNAASIAAVDRGFALVLASGIPKSAWANLALDGLIVVDPIRNDPVCAEFRRREVPIVTTGRVPGEPDGYWIDSDHFVSTPAMLDHLAAGGAQRIALVAAPPTTTYGTDMREAYEQWCRRHHQEPIVVVGGEDLSESAGYDATLRLLHGSVRPDAIFTMLDRMGLGVLLAAQAQGLSVPRDLQVACCTDSEACKLGHPPLSALALYPEEIGREAVEMVATLIDGEEPAQRHVMVKTKVIKRSSTRDTTLAEPEEVVRP
jgi:DNA-binding LacI/PurR family transcriptional regulator